jgi:hypothetical protein
MRVRPCVKAHPGSALAYLEKAFEVAPDGPVYVIARYWNPDKNFRTRFLKIIKRSGPGRLASWRKQSLSAPGLGEGAWAKKDLADGGDRWAKGERAFLGDNGRSVTFDASSMFRTAGRVGDRARRRLGEGGLTITGRTGGGAIRERLQFPTDDTGQEVGTKEGGKKRSRATQLSWPVHRLSFPGRGRAPSSFRKRATRPRATGRVMHPGRNRVRAWRRCPATCQIQIAKGVPAIRVFGKSSQVHVATRRAQNDVIASVIVQPPKTSALPGTF